MPARKKTRRRSKKKTAPSGLQRGFAIALAITVALAACVVWLRSDAGRLVLADRGLGGGADWTHDRFESAVLRTLEDLGVAPDSIVVEPGPVDGPSIVRFGTDLDLTHVNLALTVALESAGATLHRGRRTADDEGEQLELRIGTRPRLTHRIVARQGRVAPPPEPIPAARLAIVLDDLGHNVNRLTQRALALPAPVTFAILPGLTKSRLVLNQIGRAEHHALLHMPMEAEPETGYDAGEPQIRVGMDAAEIRRAVESSLDGLPGVVGVNNHMGSRATCSRPEMDAVMDVLGARGLVFLDSQTTPRSVAHVAAAAQGVPTLRNDLFLDAGNAEAPLVASRFEKLVEIALKRGWAIGIGHVNEPTISTLERLLPALEARGVALVPVAALIHDLHE